MSHKFEPTGLIKSERERKEMGRDLVPWKAPKWVPDNIKAPNSASVYKCCKARASNYMRATFPSSTSSDIIKRPVTKVSWKIPGMRG